MLECDNLRFAWPDGTGFSFDLKVAPGSILVIQGPSGVGKSTLLGLIAGLLEPSSGAIRWNGEAITALPPHDRPLSILFQDNNLFDHLDCRTNIGLGIDPGARLSPGQWQAVNDAMATLGIGGYGQRLPETLSGGQQQRVALARALLRARQDGRSLLLLDEPFSALDLETRLDCCRALRQLVEDEGLTALVVSHDPEDAIRLDAEVFAL